MKRLLLLVPILALVVSVGCAGLPRKLALANYQTAQTATDVQQQAETAERGGVLPKPAYSKILDALDLVTKAGQTYSVALVTYLANPTPDTKSQVVAALAALEAVLLKLPSSASGTSIAASVSTAAQNPDATKAIGNAKSALGVK